MARNRVEELESKVAELESTVRGLTEELVEANERIRDLEAELEPQPASGTGFGDGRGHVVAPEEFAAEFDPPAEAARGESADAAGGSSSGVEADKDRDPETEDERADSDPGDDIIVA